jgi:hypothetical protein
MSDEPTRPVPATEGGAGRWPQTVTAVVVTVTWTGATGINPTAHPTFDITK